MTILDGFLSDAPAKAESELIAGGRGKVILDGLEDAEFQEEQNERGVEQRDANVPEEVTTRVFLFLIGKRMLRAFVHENETEDVREPIADNDAALKRGRVEKADDPSKGEGQRSARRYFSTVLALLVIT